ncbi:MAG: endo-1,4-beta-xylanase [Acidimicrobiia bacterium]|nr:endo-1,4-beta-xylanase [Acidimicrobiia bacterium]
MSLRSLADAAGVRVGTAVTASPLRSEPRYRRTLVTEFNSVTAENEMKWERLHPDPDRWTTDDADLIATTAHDHGMDVRGHTLFWPHLATPDWVTQCTTRTDMLTAVADHCRGAFTRYGDTVARWDVINEPMHWLEGRLADQSWLSVIGPAWPLDVFRVAAETAAELDAAPELWLNVTHADVLSDKQALCIELAQQLLAAGLPLHGIGLQTHCLVPDFIPELPTPEHLAAVVRSVTSLGIEAAITEMDMLADPSPDGLDEQGTHYRELVAAALENPRLTEVTFWGFTDAHTWITEHFGQRAPLLFDEHYQPKPAYEGVADALRHRASLVATEETAT